MRPTTRTSTVSLLAALLVLLLPAAMKAAPSESGVSHDLAIRRAKSLSELHYALQYTLDPHSDVIHGSETLEFKSTSDGDFPLDFRDGSIESAASNEGKLAPQLENGHLNVAVVAGFNRVFILFTVNAGPAGKAITRYRDKDDGNEYLYTLFVPMDASMAFPCFDQPDLKARFDLTVYTSSDWTVISNTVGNEAGMGGGSAHRSASFNADKVTTFPQTRPISTYLFAFAAGPWQAMHSTNPAEPTLYVRKSQLTRARGEAQSVQQTAARGIAYLADYFQQPFPFPKYDLVLIPGFPFGGMEHAGATFLNEDSVLFRSAPTESDYFRRKILILHETSHQWFGDLVTMRWFDDLWLKEGFAQYMAYKALAALEPGTNPWKHFYDDIKPLAYAIDETRGTTPIFQTVPNLLDAKSAYGAIVYQKAPAVLKQLNFFLGEDTFRDGLRLYLAQHAYANAQWADLIHAFEQASQTNKQPKDVQAWAKAWILQRGMPQVELDHYSCKGGLVTEFTIRQSDVLGTTSLWPISNEIVMIAIKPEGVPATKAMIPRPDVQTLKVTWDTGRYTVREAVGKPCPAVTFLNKDDEAYGRFLLDLPGAASVATLFDPKSPLTPVSMLREVVSDKADPLLRTMLWGALWENVRTARSPARTYSMLALSSLPAEQDESLDRIQGGRLATALHAYLGPKSKQAILAAAEQVIADRMLHAPTLNLRIVNFRTFTSIAETPEALHTLKDLLALNLPIDGLTLRPLDRWNIVGHLIAMSDPEANDAFTHEKNTDHTGEGQKYAYTVAAGTPMPEIKSFYFNQYLHDPKNGQAIQEDWLTQSLRPFNSWNQTALTAPYLTAALDALPQIKRTRKIFFLGAWLSAFVDGQTSPEAQAAVHTWLAAHPTLDPDLRLKVLEASDALDRTVRIRQRFPE